MAVHYSEISKLNEDLSRISNWTFRNQLLINASKTLLIKGKELYLSVSSF